MKTNTTKKSFKFLVLSFELSKQKPFGKTQTFAVTGVGKFPAVP